MEHRCLSPWKGAVVGGLVAYVAAFVLWKAVPAQRGALRPLREAESTARAIIEKTEGPGRYVASAPESDGRSGQVSVVYVRRTLRPIRTAIRLALLSGYLVYAFAAFWWTWILGKIPGLRLRDAALYGLFFGLCAGAFGPLINVLGGLIMPEQAAWSMLGSALSWTLASMAISRCYAKACAAPAA